MDAGWSQRGVQVAFADWCIQNTVTGKGSTLETLGCGAWNGLDQKTQGNHTRIPRFRKNQGTYVDKSPISPAEGGLSPHEPEGVEEGVSSEARNGDVFGNDIKGGAREDGETDPGFGQQNEGIVGKIL